MTLADGETLTLGFARGGSFSYLAIEGGVQGEPMFGSLSVNARAGLGSPYPRPLQAGDELQVARQRRGRAPDRASAIPTARSGWCWDRRTTNSATSKKLFLDSEWKISATSDRMGYRLEGPVIKHLHGHNIVSDGTVNGSIQVPGNGAPIVLMPDRGTSGGYPKIATVISADLGRFAQIPAGRGFRFKAVGMAEAQAELRNFVKLIAPCPTACATSKILISTSKRCKMPMSPAAPSAPSMPRPGKFHLGGAGKRHDTDQRSTHAKRTPS
jgi:biotin-dependent carboxylase-like uncharacterized protein